jgi:hypothetical protein
MSLKCRYDADATILGPLQLPVNGMSLKCRYDADATILGPLQLPTLVIAILQ